VPEPEVQARNSDFAKFGVAASALFQPQRSGYLAFLSSIAAKPDIKATLEWAAAGKLKPVIDSIFPLDETAQAFDHLRSRKVLGKVLIEPFEPVSESD